MAEIDFYIHVYGTKDAVEMKEIPSADVVPRENYESMEQTVFKLTEALAEHKHGKWKNTLQGWKCSACHKEQDYSVYFDFCPNCGADMRESEGE